MKTWTWIPLYHFQEQRKVGSRAKSGLPCAARQRVQTQPNYSQVTTIALAWNSATRQKQAMGVSTGPRLSGMQKQVLSLYRAFLRAARSKSSEDRKHIESLLSTEFRRNAHLVDRKNFLYIEYLLRRGRKQLDQLKNRQTVGLTSLHISLSQPDKPT